MYLNLSETYRINLAGPPYAQDGFRLAALGNPGAGKSTLLAVLAEEAHAAGLPFLVVDVKGELSSLGELGDDVLRLGLPNHPLPARRAHLDRSEVLNHPRRFAVHLLRDHYALILDLSGQKRGLAVETFTALITAVYELAQLDPRPVLLLVDEAHNFAPQGRATRDQVESLAILDLVMSEGRSLGLLAALATQRPQEISKAVISPCNIRLFGKLSLESDYLAIQKYLPPGYRSFSRLRRFLPGEFVVWAGDYWEQVRIRSRRTPDWGATPIPQVNGYNRPSVTSLPDAHVIKQLTLLDNEH
ncbi:MAG: hypothetical protein BroJett011_63020 [Chloroflexota bacterium]|nr:MAG: hypothetical protein BroJett011_63020 [Chloroflexota bacterium]